MASGNEGVPSSFSHVTSPYLPHQLIWRITSSGLSSPVIEPIVTPPPLVGKLTLLILRCKKLHNVCSFGKMNPFIEAKISGGGEGEQKAKTAVAKGGHTNPEWGVGTDSGEKLEFLLSGVESLLRLRVFHKTLLGETVVGTARLPIDALLLLHGRSAAGQSLPAPDNCANPFLNTCWVDVGREDKQSVEAGSVLLSVHFELRSSSSSAASPAAALAQQNRGLLAACTMPLLDPSMEGKFCIVPDQCVLPNSNQQQQQNQSSASAAAAMMTGSSIDSAPFKLRGRGSTLVPSLCLPQSSSGSFSVSASSPSIAAAIAAAHHVRGSVVGNSSSSSSSSSSSASSGSGSLSSRPRLFGGSLSNGMSRSRSCVPVVVFICVQYLVHQGLSVVGLFRISSQQEAQESLKKSFESGASIEVSDPHVTADVLKAYLRGLSDPLIPSAMFQSFLNSTDLHHEDESLPLLRKLLESLPADNYTVLSYLVHFLTLVAANASVNKMNAKNCAMVFAPNVLRRSAEQQKEHKETQASMAKEMQKAEDCIHMFILHYKSLFPEGPPTPFAFNHPTKDRPNIAPLRRSTTTHSSHSAQTTSRDATRRENAHQ